MKLKELLGEIYAGKLPEGFRDREIASIHCDSRKVTKDSLFVGLPGPNVDGADFVPDAVKRGACVIIHHAASFKNPLPQDICSLHVPDPKQFWRKTVKQFYGDPSQKVKTIGITGTNGKTTITYLLESIVKKAGRRCAVIGTVNYRLGNKIISAKNTTPGLLEIQQYLSDVVKEGIDYCAMEVSSHALEQGRVDLIDFAVTVFTNLTGDHLDYHKNMENYFNAKALLFTQQSPGSFAVINQDDEVGPKLIGLTKAKIITYGLRSGVEVTAQNIQLTSLGSTFKLKCSSGQISIKTPLIGQHNIYNILAAAAVGVSQNLSLEIIKEGIESLSVVPGRLERILCGQDFHIFVDYAHTEDALKNVLTSLKKVNDARILLVFGCGGNRDKTKRPKMGRVASQFADWSFITSDNPRDEDPENIIEQIRRGFKTENYKVVPDRQEAIKEALSQAREGDIVLIAGKGHEDYQIFKDRTIHFDDRQMVRDHFKCLPSKIS